MTPVGGEFEVSSTPTGIFFPDLAVRPDGSFVIVCPGSVSLSIVNAPPNTEVALVRG